MTKALSVTARESFMGRIAHGADLLEALEKLCHSRNIRSGRISAIGAVKKARLGYYDQTEKQYRYNDFDQPLEITALSGNISLKDQNPVVHAHITLADENGHAFGGHLAPGNVVFACEFIIDVYGESDFARRFDEITGLPLWSL